MFQMWDEFLLGLFGSQGARQGLGLWTVYGILWESCAYAGVLMLCVFRLGMINMLGIKIVYYKLL